MNLGHIIFKYTTPNLASLTLIDLFKQFHFWSEIPGKVREFQSENFVATILFDSLDLLTLHRNRCPYWQIIFAHLTYIV